MPLCAPALLLLCSLKLLTPFCLTGRREIIRRRLFPKTHLRIGQYCAHERLLFLCSYKVPRRPYEAPRLDAELKVTQFLGKSGIDAATDLAFDSFLTPHVHLPALRQHSICCFEYG